VTEAARPRRAVIAIGAGLLVASAVAAPAPALAGDHKDILITTTLARTCGVTAPGDQTIDPSSLAVQPVGSVSYRCNFVGGATLRLWSQNGGQIISPASPSNGGAPQSRIYSTVFDGAALGQLTNAADTSAQTVRAIAAANTDQSGAASIQLSSAAVIAGAYLDTIFVDITP